MHKKLGIIWKNSFFLLLSSIRWTYRLLRSNLKVKLETETQYCGILGFEKKIPKAAITTGRRHKQRFIAQSSGGWELETKSLADTVSGERLLPGSWMAVFLLCGKKARGSLGSPFVRALIQSMRVPSSWPRHLPEAPPSEPHHTELGVSTWMWERHNTPSPVQCFSDISYRKRAVNWRLVNVWKREGRAIQAKRRAWAHRWYILGMANYFICPYC